VYEGERKLEMEYQSPMEKGKEILNQSEWKEKKQV
jgi:hypothetical protein